MKRSSNKISKIPKPSEFKASSSKILEGNSNSGGVHIYVAGEPDSPLNSSTGSPVIYEVIKRSHNSSNLYEDPDFPANSTSLGNIGGDTAARSGAAAKKSNYKWLRPHELCKSLGISKPTFATAQDQELYGPSVQQCSSYDMKQGGIGDCWYLAALSALTERQDQLKLIIPQDNFIGFEPESYCGAFHFRFYSMFHNKWIDVVIDDRLPCTKDGSTYIPAFAQVTLKFINPQPAEFWPALLEKAYAKFIGSYAKIEDGYTSQALEDFTGGFSEIVNISEPLEDNHGDDGSLASISSSTPKSSYYEIFKARMMNYELKGNFMALDTFSEEGAFEEGCLDGYSDYVDTIDDDGILSHVKTGYKYNSSQKKIVADKTKPGLGLCPGHAYTVLEAVQMESKDGKSSYFLLKVRNPHATHEWSGDFSDTDDANWSKMKTDLRTSNKNPKVKAKAKGSKKGSTSSSSTVKWVDEGIFWIELKDVLKYFQLLEFCTFGLDDGTKFCCVQGEWPASLQTKSILGSESDLKYFTAYKFEARRELLRTKIPGRVGLGNDSKCLAAFQIILGDYHPLLDPMAVFKFFLYKVTEADLTQPLTNLTKNNKPYDTSTESYAREVSEWMYLDPGTYVIIPVLKTISDDSEEKAAKKKTTKKSKSLIPKDWVGKGIRFGLRIFTENETSLTVIPPDSPEKIQTSTIADNKRKSYSAAPSTTAGGKRKKHQHN